MRQLTIEKGIMDKTKKKKILELMEYLLHQRRMIEETGFRIDPDLRKTYKWINEKIQDLQLDIFVSEYDEFERNLDKVLEMAPPFQD
jgi:hypothetical protein